MYCYDNSYLRCTQNIKPGTSIYVEIHVHRTLALRNQKVKKVK